MTLSANVKSQPMIFRFLPFLSRYQGITIGENIYLRQDIYDDLHSSHPDPKNISILIHEQTHVQRIQQIGVLQFGLKYLCLPHFRFNEELISNKASFTYLKKHKIPVDLVRKAKILSSWIYLCPVPYEFAKSQVDKAWKEA